VIRQAVARGERVLATAASNAAVDNLSERLVNLGVDAVRIGHPARVSAAMESRTLDALLERTDAWRLARQWMAEAAEIRKRALVRFERGSIGGRDKRDAFADANRLSRDARKQLQGAQALIVDRARVLCATAAGADAALLPDEPFDLVVIDEATQATDPVALVALSRGRRAVLAGDPHQLPPTVIDLEAAREGLQTTFFERLAGTGQDLVRMLVVQHRMNEAIMAFPSASKYEGRLVAAPEVAGHTLADLGVEDDPLRPGPLVLVDTAGKGWEERREGEDPSTSNPLQAERTAREVRRLLSRGLAPGLAAVITPYDAQVRLLRELLEPEVRAGLEVGTVDGFQGREKEAIVVDLVRSNDEGRIGFLGDTRRMNVALTRARRFLLVIGDSATIGGDRYYSELVEAFEVYGAVVSAWTDEADPLQS
jgi:predicted DNA helicase